MKKQEWLKMLAGSMLIYVIVAGCGAQARVAVEEMLDAAADVLDAGTSIVVAQLDSGSSESPSPNDTTAETPRVPDASTPGPSIVDPVPPASAQEPAPCQCEPAPAPVVEQPEIVEVPCEAHVVGGETSLIAEAEFPGRSALELAKVVALAHWPTDNRFGYPYGYRSATANVAVRDGSVAVYCGAEGTGDINQTVNIVTFILTP